MVLTGNRAAHDMTQSDHIEQRILALERDTAWINDVMAYAQLDAGAMADLLGCFFLDRKTEALAPRFPSWSDETSGRSYEEKRAEVMRSRGWEEINILQELVHLELIGRHPVKRGLHVEWLTALERHIREDAAFYMLDYGSGPSSFTELGLGYPGLHSTLVDVTPQVMGYAEAKYAKSGGRVSTIVLPSSKAKLGLRNRLRVDYRCITGQFDFIVASDCLEHTLDPLGALLHLLGCLRPGGVALINYPDCIEGDWHTPEANYLRRWCYTALRMTCENPGGSIWIRNGGPGPALVSSVFQIARPFLCARSRTFARNYFRRRGVELVESIRTKTRRNVEVEELISSVDNSRSPLASADDSTERLQELS
jgi:SAM-dependent methyltransferase